MLNSGLKRDSIEIHKTNGAVIPNLFASVQTNKVFMDANGHLVEAGDEVIRRTSVGHVERYKVISPGFRERSQWLPAHYQMKVQQI